MKEVTSAVLDTIKNHNMKLRPGANAGLWMAGLLPAAVISCAIKYPIESSFVYKSCAIFTLGFLCTTFILVWKSVKEKHLNGSFLWYFVSAVLVSSLFRICLKQGILFSVYGGFFSVIGYHKLFQYCLYYFPHSFSVGEAFLVSQATSLFLYSSSVHFFNSVQNVPLKVSHISTSIIQLGLMGIGVTCLGLYNCPSLRKPPTFYFASIVGVFTFTLIPLHFVLKRSPVIWIFSMIIDDKALLTTVIFWSILSAAAAVVVYRKINGAEKASTVVRKIFHLLAVAVYVPGLLYHCNFLYLATGVVFGIFIILDVLRVLNIPPLGQHLQNGFTVFSDEKDAGLLALTPVYLLVGFSLPLWLHPAPCDVTNSAGFNLLPLLSGILSIGIGDTAAAAVGSIYGIHKWPGTKKSFEGTAACILSQAIVVAMFLYLGILRFQPKMFAKVTTAVIVSSIIEAKTTQVDNIVLPLVMFVMLT